MKRTNKSKEQIQREMAAIEKQKAKLDKEKFIAKTVFPFVENLKTIYDAQTAFNAASGYIQYGLAAEESKITVAHLKIVLNTKKDGDVGKAVENIINSMANVSAKDVAGLLERMGQKLAEYVANKGLKEPMTIKTKDFVA